MASSFKRKVSGFLAALLCWAGGMMACFGADGSGTFDNGRDVWYPTAENGDTYTITSPHSWTAEWVLNRDVSVNIKGQGMDTTVITDNRTTNIALFRNEAPSATVHIEISDFEVAKGTNPVRRANAIFQNTGHGTFSYHHVRDNDSFGKFFNQRDGSAIGVVYNNIIRSTDGNTTKMWFFHSQWGQATYTDEALYGDGSWADPLDIGGWSAIYVEDNTFEVLDGKQDALSDQYGGSRVVFRRNTLNEYNFSSHGTGDGSGLNRGPRKVEYYDNVINILTTDNQLGINNRGGYVLVARNTYSPNMVKSGAMKQYLYNSHHGKFGQTDGDNPFDINDTSDDGTGHDSGGTAGDGIFEAGTTTGGSGSATLQDTTQSWTNNEWYGYSVQVETDNLYDYPRGYIASVVTANTATTLTLQDFANTTPGMPENFNPESTATELSFNDANPDTITRSSGSFLDDGFIDGYDLPVVIETAEDAGNNGKYRTTSVTATTITLHPDGEDSGNPEWKAGEVTANASDTTATVKMVKWGGDHPVWKKNYFIESGRPYVIKKADLSMDQVGAGRSDIITFDLTGQLHNTPPNNSKTADGTKDFAPFWFQDGDRIYIDINQEYEPSYIFHNVHPGDLAGMQGEAGIVHGYHYFEETAGGVGVGTLASRPASGSVLNEGYWATDANGTAGEQYDWLIDGDTGGEADGVLYQWNGSAWVQWWAPAPYPHYLRAAEDPTDVTPPTPSPMTFSVAPTAVGPSAVTMTATTATDATGPVQYQINTNGGIGNSSWQASAEFTISGLLPATEYDFMVRARDSAEVRNVTDWSAVASATTFIASTTPSVTASGATAGSVTVGP